MVGEINPVGEQRRALQVPSRQVLVFEAANELGERRPLELPPPFLDRVEQLAELALRPGLVPPVGFSPEAAFDLPAVGVAVLGVQHGSADALAANNAPVHGFLLAARKAAEHGDWAPARRPRKGNSERRRFAQSKHGHILALGPDRRKPRRDVATWNGGRIPVPG
jgi:hypothetical protein